MGPINIHNGGHYAHEVFLNSCEFSSRFGFLLVLSFTVEKTFSFLVFIYFMFDCITLTKRNAKEKFRFCFLESSSCLYFDCICYLLLFLLSFILLYINISVHFTFYFCSFNVVQVINLIWSGGGGCFS